MSSTRRDLFKFAGGTAAGALLTPVPWNLVRDVTLWTQNWPGIPSPARGEITARYTNCALCPAGCAVRARCVGGHPVLLAGAGAHPLSRGALCAAGVAGHHLPYHPGRVREGPAEVAAASVANAIEKCGPEEYIAVLDLRPGRTASWTYRRAMAALKRGLYLRPPGGELAYDLGKAKLVVSLGVGLLEDWGTPGNVVRAREGFRLIQADAVESRTAALADVWLRIRPGSERALARALLAGTNAGETGLSERQFAELAGELEGNRPALVLAEEDIEEAAALNQRTGAWGSVVVRRREAPVPAAWQRAAPEATLEQVPDGSIRALLIDESVGGDYIAWSAIQRKLVRDSPVVVTFAPTREGYGRHALFVLPTAVYPEVLDDVPAAVDSPQAMFRIAVPLVEAPAGMVSGPEFVARAAKLPVGDPLRERAAAIHSSGRGVLVRYAEGEPVPAREVAFQDFREALYQGGCWIDGLEGAGPARRARESVAGGAAAGDRERPLEVVVVEKHGAGGPASPLMTKLGRESNLRVGRGRVALHPDSARASGLRDNASAVLETELGSHMVTVVVDASVPPGIVAAAAEPAVLDICGDGSRARVGPA